MTIEFEATDTTGFPTIDKQVTAPPEAQTGGEVKPGAPGAPEAGEAKAGEPPTPEQKPAEKDKGNLQKRFDELAAEKWAARQEAEEAKRRAQELEAKLAASQKAPVSATGKPVREKFETEEEYIEALIAYNTDQRLDAARKADEEQRNAADAQERQARLRGKLMRGTTKHEDFQKVAFDTPFPYTPLMLEALTRIDDPAGVAYHLGKNPQIGFELAGMRDPLEIAAKIGEIQAMVKAGPMPEPKGVTKAPEPAKPITGGGGGVPPDAETLARMNQSEFNAYMWKVRQAKGHRL